MFIACWGLGALLTAGLAYRKGRSPLAWFLLAWTITPVLALALVWWRPRDTEGLTRRRVRQGERWCPHCGAFGSRDAPTCPACHAALPPLPTDPAEPLAVPEAPAACLACGGPITSLRPAFACPVCD